MRLTITIILLIQSVFGIAQLTNYYDTCRTYLYYQHIGSSTNPQEVVKARTIQDHGIISLGTIPSVTGSKGLVMKQDKNGIVLWKKSFSGTAGHTSFTGFRELPDKKLLVSGVFKPTGSASAMVVMKLSETGEVIWQKSFVSHTGSEIKNTRVYSYQNYIFFAAVTDSSMIYGIFDQSGNRSWQKSFKTDSTTRLVDITAEAGNLQILTNATESGFKVVNEYYIRYYWYGSRLIENTKKLGGSNQQANYIMHDMEHTSLYSYFSGIRSINNQPYKLVRLNIKQGSYPEALETINTPGITLGPDSRTAIGMYGDCIAFTNSRKSNNVSMVQMSASNNQEVIIHWSATSTLPDSMVLNGSLKTWDGGYKIFGTKENVAGSKTLQLKVDSASLTPACIPRNSQNFTLQRHTFPTDTVSYVYTIDSLIPSAYLMMSASIAIDTITICKQLFCPIQSLADTCSKGFHKLYRGYNRSNGVTSMSGIKDHIFISGLAIAHEYLLNSWGTYVAKFNKDGQIIKQKNFLIGAATVGQIRKTRDSSLIMFGTTSDSAYYPSFFLAKIDTNLNLIKINSLRLTATAQIGGIQRVCDVQQASDGSFFALLSNGISFGEKRLYLIKFNENGEYLWSKVYRPVYSGYANEIKGDKLLLHGDHVFITAINTYNSYAASIVLKVLQSNGSLLWCKKYSTADEYINLSGAMVSVFNNELYFVGGTVTLPYAYRNIIVKTDLDGNVNTTKSFIITEDNTSPAVKGYQHTDGSLFISSNYFRGTPPVIDNRSISFKLNPDLTIVRAKGLPIPLLKSPPTDMLVDESNHLFETGTESTSLVDINANYYPYLKKYTPTGESGTCPSDTVLFNNISIPVIATNISCGVSDSIFDIRIPVNTAEQHYLAEFRQMCISVALCTSIDIQGPTAICNTTQLYTFQGIRNTNCLSPVLWDFDPAQIQLMAQTDQGIIVKFLTTGNIILRATLFSNCIPYRDSIIINVFNGVLSLNLGPDLYICTATPIILNAQTGYTSYLWQNGSTNSTFTVPGAGLYHVSVTDPCGNTFRDSVRVTIIGNVPLLNLGPDRNFCTQDTIILTAQAGYKSYLWQNGSAGNIFTVTTPGLYHVTAIDSCNNIHRDSIFVYRYRKANTLHIGRDSTMCSFTPITVSAGSGFKYYLWQNGSTGTTLNATAPGLYYVTVTDSCNNTFSDSMAIQINVPLPFDLGPGISKCNTDTVALTVNSGFSNYIWSPSSGLVSVNNNNALVRPLISMFYYVTATNANGCTVKDSIFITVNQSLPINLGIDKSFCTGDSILLNAGTGFVQYLWSGGETTSSIYAHSSGQFNVRAIDANQCISYDSIKILPLFLLPSLTLNRNMALCAGQSTMIHAGNGYLSYLWGNGETTSSISVNSLGNYWVTVINSNGCKKTDTASVTTLRQSPKDFLGQDTVICMYTQATIQSQQSFASYLWNTGENSASISAPEGTYWLKVTDNAGCTGTDSLKVLTKICSQNIYFPNSFTPNGDGMNDQWKPIIKGNMETYEIVIYNRYGHKVFASTIPQNSWDGRHLSTAQDQNAFVWICTYKFKNEQLVTEKGTVLLVR